MYEYITKLKTQALGYFNSILTYTNHSISCYCILFKAIKNYFDKRPTFSYPCFIFFHFSTSCWPQEPFGICYRLSQSLQTLLHFPYHSWQTDQDTNHEKIQKQLNCQFAVAQLKQHHEQKTNYCILFAFICITFFCISFCITFNLHYQILKMFI